MNSKEFNKNYKVKVVGELNGEKVNSLCGYARFRELFGEWGESRLGKFDEWLSSTTGKKQSRTFSLRSKTYSMYVTIA